MLYRLTQFSHADQLILNTARSLGYRMALVVTPDIGNGEVMPCALAVAHDSAALRDPDDRFSHVPLQEIEGL